MLNWCIKKLNEVSLDLREPQEGAKLEHQADKLDKVREELEALRSLLLPERGQRSETNVHGGGTGRE